LPMLAWNERCLPALRAPPCCSQPHCATAVAAAASAAAATACISCRAECSALLLGQALDAGCSLGWHDDSTVWTGTKLV